MNYSTVSVRYRVRAAVLGFAVAVSAFLPEPALAAFYKNLQRLPQACRAVADTQLLDCYLTNEPQIAMPIEWISPMPLGEARLRRWVQWAPGLKAELRQEFALAMEWYKQALPHLRRRRGTDPTAPPSIPPSGPPPAPLSRFQDPVPSLPKPDYYTGAHIAEQTARRIYLSYVANSLAAEITGAHPWSIRTYDAEELRQLLNYFEMVSMHTGIGRYQLGAGWYTTGIVSPANATYGVDFLRRNELIELTPRATIGGLLGWSHRLVHFFKSDNVDRADPEEFWGPDAFPAPQSFIIEKTVYTGQDSGWDEPQHYTPGCPGTADFLVWTLRSVNLPVMDVSPVCEHRTPYFMTIESYLSHADDVHNTRLDNDPPIPGEELLVPKAQYEEWFPPEEEDPTGEICKSNVGRRGAEVAIDYLSDGLLELYCDDTKLGKSHAEGELFDALDKFYALEELEAIHLWENLAAKAASKGLNCD